MSNLHKTAATVSLFFAPKEKKSALRDLKEMINDYGLVEELNNAVLKKCGDLYNKLCIAWDSFRGGYGDKEELQDLQCQYNDIWEDCANNLLYAMASKKSNGLFLDKHFLHKTAMSPADIGCHEEETTPVERSTQMVGYETPTTNNFALRVAPLDGEEDKFKLEIDTDKKKDKVTVDKINPPPSVPNSSQSLLNKPEEEANSKGVGSTTYNDLFEVVDKEFPVAEIFASRSSDLFFDNYFLHKTAAPEMENAKFDPHFTNRLPLTLANFEIEKGIYIEADLKSKTPYLVKDLEKANIDKKEFDKIIETCNQADPTGDMAVYTQWILRQYLNNNFKGEEDIDKFKDILTKFTKLKNSKRIDQADINQYKSYAELTEKVNNILNESGGYTSKREEEITKTEEGIQKVDQDGDIELFVVDTPDAASKEFRNTEWCVKDPKWFNQYADTDSNFYYFKKDGKPYLLLHKNDFRDIYDGEPNNENLQDVAKLMLKHNLPHQYSLISQGIITEESDKELFDKLVNQAINDGHGSLLLFDRIITKENSKEWFDKLVNQAIKEGEVYELIAYRIITKESDKELFDKLVNQAINDGHGSLLLGGRIITREDGELFNKLVTQDVKEGKSYKLLVGRIITREDGELFNKAVDQAIKDGHGYDLLKAGVITQDSPYYGKAVEKLLNQSIKYGFGYSLLKDGVITQDSPYYDRFLARIRYGLSDKERDYLEKKQQEAIALVKKIKNSPEFSVKNLTTEQKQGLANVIHFLPDDLQQEFKEYAEEHNEASTKKRASTDFLFNKHMLHKTAAPDMVHLDDGCSYDYKSDSYQDVPTVGNTMGTIPADREANELNKDYGPHAQAVHGDKAPNIKLFIDMSKDKPFSHGKDTINHLGIKFEEYEDEDIDVSFPKASQIECESSFKATSGVVGDVRKNVKGNVKGEMKGKVTDGQGRGTKGTIGDGNSIKPTASSNVPVSDSIRFFELPQAYKEPEDIKLKLEKDGKGNGLSLSVLKPNTNKDDYSRNMSGVGNGDAPNCINDGLNQKFDMGGDTGAIGDEGFSAKTTEISGFAAEDLGKEDTWYTDKEKDSHDVDHV